MRTESFAYVLRNFLRHNAKSISFLLMLGAAGLGHLFGQEQPFPKNWEGKWTGTLEIYYQNQLRQAVPMELSIRSIDSIRWEYLTVYSPSENPVRKAYELIAQSPERGQYIIDEKNGILLNAQFQGECLYSAFEVMGNHLQSRICLLNGKLHYEITSGPASPHKTTGDTIIESDTIPPVQVFALSTVQRAVLQHQPE